MSCGRQPQDGSAPQELGLGAQGGGPGFGIATQPPEELPLQNCMNVVPDGHPPPSSSVTHSGCGPQEL
jgi:hypothetical protein